jgi:hypothetical protein
MSRSAITQGIAEMAHPKDAAPPGRARMFGGGRKKSVRNPCYEKEPGNLPDSPVTGNPEKPLRYVSKSTGNLSEALKVHCFASLAMTAVSTTAWGQTPGKPNGFASEFRGAPIGRKGGVMGAGECLLCKL